MICRRGTSSTLMRLMLHTKRPEERERDEDRYCFCMPNGTKALGMIELFKKILTKANLLDNRIG